MSKQLKIIYFVKGTMPSKEAKAAANKYAANNANVVFRNVRFINETDKCEVCDGVMGDVPAQYKREGFVSADEAISKLVKSVENETAKKSTSKKATAKTTEVKAEEKDAGWTANK